MKKRCPIPSAGAVLGHAEGSSVHNQLDLHGTGERADVILPFIYLYREPGVRYDLIETSGYSSGYGGFHKVPLCKRFKGVEGVVDLQDKLREGKKITYLTKSGLESGNPVEGCIYPLVQSWGA